MSCKVKWGDSYSDGFDVALGTKQGGINSPDFFSVYVDDMIKLLRKRGIGCHIISIFIACIKFADDLTLLAPCRVAMQEMLQICASYCKKFCLSFDVKKSNAMFFGKPSCDNFAPLLLNNRAIEYVANWKYLGATIISGKCFGFSSKSDVASFYGRF